MKILNIKISGQEIQWENSFPIVSGSQEYLYCKFSYPKNWEELNKQIRFYNTIDKKYYEIENLSGLVKIPSAVLTSDEFYIAVGGYETETNIFAPTSSLKISMLNNGNSAHAEGVGSTADNNGAHAEGCQTTVLGAYGHSEGYCTEALGNYSRADE